MVMDIGAKAAVRFDADAVKIQETPHILLCASLFYFRIPSALWKERMEQLKAFGYNSIDVYFPWNYHETAEGEWDFSGERDIAAFLTTAAEVGLYVVARPGPYICSEWDGGALPAYLLTKGLKLRDNDAEFIGYVSKWFDHILPLLKQNQAGEGGTVIGVQLDNELDFYDCHDPKGYISALRDMVLDHGITVPLFACAGQGGLLQASGLAEDVVPTCNFYPDNREAEFEDKVLHYSGTLAKLGYPLLVTETNRAHYLLRRLLSCGAKLLGPYLQVSGTDFGFTNATNNWGKPLAFMTSDYDFGGMISPEGHIREEAYEGRLLGRMIAAYGTPLAEAASQGLSTDWKLIGQSDRVVGPYALQLKGGGNLLFVTNLDDQDKELAIVMENDTSTKAASSFKLKSGRSLTLPSQVPLQHWGVEGSLESSTAELYMAETNDTGASLAFHTEGYGEIVLLLDAAPVDIKALNATVETIEGGKVRIAFEGKVDSVCSIITSDGHTLKLFITDRMKALYSEGLNDADDTINHGKPLHYSDRTEMAAAEWRLNHFDAASPMNKKDKRGPSASRKADYLEQHEIYRGYAWYEATVRLAEDKAVKGILICSGSDVVSLYAGGEYAGTAVAGGGSSYLHLSNGLQDGKLLARVEIWGHSNFDDARLPGLRLHAMKGIKGLSAITEVRDLSRNWSVYRAADRILRKELIESPDSSMWPIVNFGGWMSPDHPAFEYYRKTFRASEAADSWTLHFQGIQSLARLFVNGKEIGEVHPFDPYFNISEHVTAGQSVELTVFVERVLGLPSGQVYLYEGQEADNFAVYAAEEEALLEHAESLRSQSGTTEFPISLEPGETAWLYATTVNSEAGKGWRAKISGTSLKMTVFLEGRIVGRLWLPSQTSRPVMSGGSPDSFYLPGAWYEGGEGSLTILLEAVDQEKQGCLEAIQFISV